MAIIMSIDACVSIQIISWGSWVTTAQIWSISINYLLVAQRARVWRSRKIEKELIHVLSTASKWKTPLDKYIEYPEKEMEMRMIVTIKSE
jgi:hypothetical protein